MWLFRGRSTPLRCGDTDVEVGSSGPLYTNGAVDVLAEREKMWIYTLRSIAPHSFYGSNHSPPTLLACFYFELGWINRIAGHIRKNTNDQIWQWPISPPCKLYLASHTVDKTTGLPYGCARKLRTINNGQTTTSQPPTCMSNTTRTGTSPWRPKTS